MGHERSPLFISDDALSPWLDPIKKDPKELLALLSRNKALPGIIAEQDEPMKAGWEKRIKDHS